MLLVQRHDPSDDATLTSREPSLHRDVPENSLVFEPHCAVHDWSEIERVESPLYRRAHTESEDADFTGPHLVLRGRRNAVLP